MDAADEAGCAPAVAGCCSLSAALSYLAKLPPSSYGQPAKSCRCTCPRSSPCPMTLPMPNAPVSLSPYPYPAVPLSPDGPVSSCRNLAVHSFSRALLSFRPFSCKAAERLTLICIQLPGALIPLLQRPNGWLVPASGSSAACPGVRQRAGSQGLPAAGYLIFQEGSRRRGSACAPDPLHGLLRFEADGLGGV